MIFNKNFIYYTVQTYSLHCISHKRKIPKPYMSLMQEKFLQMIKHKILCVTSFIIFYWDYAMNLPSPNLVPREPGTRSP